MKRITLLVAASLIAVLVPATALAYRHATRSERSAVLAAVARQHQLTPKQAACQRVWISTVNQSFALLSWPAKLSSACQKVAANGEIIEHRRGHTWHFVAAGSSWRCPIKGVPLAVARDLRVCH